MMTQNFSFIDNLTYAQTGKPLNNEGIETAQRDLSYHNLPQLPQDVVEFLKLYNGFQTEGRTIFGIDSEKHFFYDIIGENLNAGLEDFQDILLLGETDVTWIGWIASENSYAIIDKDIHKVLHKLDNFVNAVKYILQINE